MIIKEMINFVKANDINTAEAWEPIIDQVMKEVQHVKLGWGSHSELIAFYFDNEFYACGNNHDDVIEEIESRYKISHKKAIEIFKVLYQYNELRQLANS